MRPLHNQSYCNISMKNGSNVKNYSLKRHNVASIPVQSFDIHNINTGFDERSSFVLLIFVDFVVFLFCFSSSCVPYIASFSGLCFLIALSVFSHVYSPSMLKLSFYNFVDLSFKH